MAGVISRLGRSSDFRAAARFCTRTFSVQAQVVARFDPDLLILDISMPVLDGIKAASRLKATGSRPLR